MNNSQLSTNLKSLSGLGFVIAACTLWAFDTLIRYPLMAQGVSAINIVFYEHILLNLIFIIVFFKSIKSLIGLKISHYFYFFVVGGVGSALATLAFTRAFYFLNPSLVILLQKFQPVWAILLARIVLKEKTQKLFWFWAIVCLMGGLLISYEDLLQVFASDQQLNFFSESAVLGYVLVLISTIGWGASTVFGKKLSLEGYSDEQIMGGRFSFGLICLAPFMLQDQTLFTHNIEVYSKLSLMVLISGLLAMYLYYQGLRKITARACSLAEMFFPFMAIIVNWLILGKTLSPIQMLGGVALLLGSLVIQIKRY